MKEVIKIVDICWCAANSVRVTSCWGLLSHCHFFLLIYASSPSCTTSRPALFLNRLWALTLSDPFLEPRHQISSLHATVAFFSSAFFRAQESHNLFTSHSPHDPLPLTSRFFNDYVTTLATFFTSFWCFCTVFEIGVPSFV